MSAVSTRVPHHIGKDDREYLALLEKNSLPRSARALLFMLNLPQLQARLWAL